MSWSRFFEYCLGCGTVERAHKASGYCTACYMRCHIRSGRSLMTKRKWSRLFDHCQNCGGTKSKHRSGGLCHLCYKAKDRSKRYQLHGTVNDWPEDPITFQEGAKVLHLGRYEAIVRGTDAKGLVICVIAGAVWHVPAAELVRA